MPSFAWPNSLTVLLGLCSEIGSAADNGFWFIACIICLFSFLRGDRGDMTAASYACESQLRRSTQYGPGPLRPKVQSVSHARLGSMMFMIFASFTVSIWEIAETARASSKVVSIWADALGLMVWKGFDDFRDFFLILLTARCIELRDFVAHVLKFLELVVDRRFAGFELGFFA